MDILLISQAHILREALVVILQNNFGNQICGASSRETVEAALAAFAPALVIVDASHPEGGTLVTAVRAHAPEARVVVLAAGERDEEFLAWAQVGISGYLGPDTSADDLLSAVRRVGAGEVACPPRLTALLMNRCSSSRRADRAELSLLTPREQEIAKLLADGLSNRSIAGCLCIESKTVRNHVYSILKRWDCQSRGEAAARYRRQVWNDERQGDGKITGLQAGLVSYRISPHRG